MATIINYIAFQNFYNYYGSYDANTYNFSRGINIVNADNNMGKSKFYNGILWLLEDKVYDSDTKSKEESNRSYIKMLSGKAREEKSSMPMGIKVSFTDGDITYTVTKSIKFSYNDNSIVPGTVNISVLKTEANHDAPVYDVDEQKSIINLLIPLSLRNYALLQGESMEKLVDLSSRDGLSSTIDALAGIKILKEICETSKKLFASAKTQYNQKDQEVSSKTREEEQERDKYEQNIARIESINEEIEAFQKDLEAAKDQKEVLEAFIASAGKRGDIRANIERLKDQIEREKRCKSNIEASITQKLFNEQSPWILMGLEDEIEKFNSRRERHIGDLALLDSDQTLVIMLPEGSPDLASLQRMLEHEECEVCGQKALKGSDAWNHIKMILQRPEKKATTRNNLNHFWGNLSKNASAYTICIPQIASSIDSVYNKIESIQEEIDSAEERFDSFITELSNAGGNSSNTEDSDINILETYKLAQETINTTTQIIENRTQARDQLQYAVDRYERRQTKPIPNSEVAKYKRVKEVVECIVDIFKETQERIFDNILTSLEQEANIKYASLTEGNQSSGGRLSFKKQPDGTVKVSIRDINNGVITGLGTGFQRMKQLSIVMAIISSKIGDKSFDYPFISDAPFSEFGENFISNFFNIAPKVFTQSIILIKELYDPKDKDLLTNFGKRILSKMKEGEIPGTFYVNIIEDRADTTGLVTNHKCYKN